MSTHRIRIVPAAGIALTVTGDVHQRLNHGPQELQRHWRIVVPPMTAVGDRPQLGVDAQACPFTSSTPPLDAALGGKLYQWSWGIEGAEPAPPLTNPVSSAQVVFNVDERHVGLWLLTCWRADNGAASIPLEVAIG